MIARSKQLYNKKYDLLERRLQEVDNRPKKEGWRSGPAQPYSKLLGLFL